MSKPVLTPRQRQAKKVYRRALKSAMFANFLIFIAAEIVILVLLGLLLPSSVSHFPGALIIIGTPLVNVFAHRRAIAAVRRAGLSDESREIIARTATISEGETLVFRYPTSAWGKAALIAAFCALTVAMWWFWQDFAADFANRAVGAAGFAFFLALTILTLATAHLPNDSLDNRGIFAYRYSVWPTLVRWHKIESAEIYRFTHFNNGPDLFTVTLKDAAGQTLLMLNPNTFAGSSAQWQQQFIAELRRRLTAATS